MKKILIAFTVLVAAFACQEDEAIVDQVDEYVSFSGSNTITLNELVNSGTAHPVVVQLWASAPFKEDVNINFTVTGTNSTAGVDFIVTPANQVKIKAGKFLSDPIFVKTINDEAGSDLDRLINISITSIDKPGIGLGLGGVNKTNKSVVLNIIDDDCNGSPLCVYHTTELTTTVDWGGGPILKPAVGVVDKGNNKITVSGDLIDYAELPLTITLTPSSPGALSGSATFGEQEVGEAWDGYPYKFVQTGAGTYDSETRTISISFDIYWYDGGWWYWYSVTDIITAP
jgi:hypothetical protein